MIDMAMLPVAANAANAAAPASASTAPPATPAAAAPVPTASTADPSVPPAIVADPQAANATAPTAATAATANAAQATAPAAGVTFPVRPATTTATQAPAPAVGHASAADAGSVGGALFSLVLVIGLILILGWLAKRMPGMQRGAGASALKVVASVALGPRDRAVVVDVGGTQLLLGVGPGGVRTLHTLDAPLPVATASVPSPFAQILAQHFGRKP